MENIDKKTSKALRRYAQQNLFKLIDSFEKDNIELAIALISHDRGLRYAAKHRYYPILRHIDPHLSTGWALLHRVRPRLKSHDEELFSKMYNMYTANGDFENVRELLQQTYEKIYTTLYYTAHFLSMLQYKLLIPPRPIQISLYSPLPENFTFPPRILEKVETIHIQCDIALKQISPYIKQITTLRRLHIYNCNIPNIPPDLLNPNLTELEISNANLTTIPDEITQLSQLKVLRLDSNPITYIPDSIAQLSNLELLNLHATTIDSLPQWMPQLANLKELNIDSTYVTVLPETVFQIPNLETLIASSCQISHFAPAPSHSLSQLYLSDNPLKELPENINLLSALTEISLTNTKIKRLPEALFNCTAIQNLYLSNTAISAISTAVAQLKQLQCLAISNTQIYKLPAPLKALPLIEIRFSEYQIQQFYKKLKSFIAAIPHDCQWWPE